MCKANHTEEMSFFKRLFQETTKASEETKEIKRVYYEGPRDLVRMGILPGSVRQSDEPTYVAKRFCLGLDEDGSSVRLEWIPGKRIRLVKNRRDELDIEKLPEMKLTHYKGEEVGIWERLSNDQKREFATVVANANAVVQISDIFSKEISLDIMDKAYEYASEMFDPSEPKQAVPETTIRVLAALKAAAATLKKAIEKIDDDDDDDTDTESWLRCHRPKNVVTEVNDEGVVIESSEGEDQDWIDTDNDSVEAEPTTPETPEPAETPAESVAETLDETLAEPAVETPAEPAVETPAEPAVETPAEPMTKTPAEPAAETTVETPVETPAEPAAEPKPVFDDTPDDPAEVKKSSKKKKRK